MRIRHDRNVIIERAMMTRRLAAFLITGTIAIAAQADSDGHYCVGANYLAYELRFAQPGVHTLVVLRAGPSHSMDEVKVALPDFQVHGMRCTAEAVELAAWDGVHALDLSANPPRVSFEAFARPGDLPKWPYTNLTQWKGMGRSSDSAILDLPWDVPHSVKITAAPTQQECVRKLTARLYRSGVAEPVMTLLDRETHIECGE
jgi:hypothetical protein